MNIKNQFKTFFTSQEEITTKQIVAWYREASHSASHKYQSNVHITLIQPLEHEGFLQRVGRGVYRINSSSNSFTFREDKVDLFEVDFNNKELDELDEYLNKKIQEVTHGNKN